MKSGNMPKLKMSTGPCKGSDQPKLNGPGGDSQGRLKGGAKNTAEKGDTSMPKNGRKK